VFRNGPQNVKALLPGPARAKDVTSLFLKTGILNQFRKVDIIRTEQDQNHWSRGTTGTGPTSGTH
jgi:hypothetical protein